MPSTYSGNLLLELMADGENDGLWGDISNENLEVLGRAISGVTTVSLAGTTHTLTVSQGALSEGHYMILELGGSPTGTNTITINPNTVARLYLVKNSSGEDAVFTQGSGGNVTVADGKTAIIYSDGGGSGAKVTEFTADFLRASNNLSDVASASTARSNLGITATTDAIGALTPTDGNFIVGNGSTWITENGDTALASLGITATATELNKLDGVTWTLLDYNTLTSTAAELNLLDGVTWTLADYNTLTSTAAELNLLDGKSLSGSDSSLITGTAGTAGHLTRWDTNGDLVSYGQATQTEGAWQTGTSTTESLVSPAKVRAAIEAGTTEVSEVPTTSGTAVTLITGIPSGINTVELYFYDISISASDFIVVQLGTSVSWSTSGYIGGIESGSSGYDVDTGFPAVVNTGADTDKNSGIMQIKRVPGTNKWVASSQVYHGNGTGSIALAADLTRVRVTTNGGTATFDNGGISARYY